MRRFALKGGVAVITGAAGGIGQCLSLKIARAGCAVALVDKNTDGLKRTGDAARAFGVRVSTHAVDLANPADVAALPRAIEETYGRVTLLVNNAGLTMFGDFWHITPEAFDTVMQINFNAPVQITRGLLPLLGREPQAQIVNISSLFGLIAAREQSPYCASKFALRGFSEALRMDLADSNIGVTLVHPGGIDTDIARGSMMAAGADAARDPRAHAQKYLVLSPEAAARQIFRAIRWRQWRVIVGRDARFMSVIQRLYPVFYQKLMLWGDRR
ncbi:MAG: SDR family NAD(P)-dependent oxidoreductase [PS1 clade bacterium]|nr:SDR family NAD(P)-dependent oxidoreductase [PS1 clade bacterium]